MAKGDWYFKFELPAWRTPSVRSCSLATRGFWLECIGIMRESGKAVMSGTYEEFAKVTGCFPDEAKACIDELKRYKTADVTLRNDGVTVNVTLKSRKYARELKAKEQSKLRVKKFRSNANVTLDVTHEKRLLETSNKKLEIKEEEIREAAEPQTEPEPMPVDDRINHPAIVAIHAAVGIYPPREIWNDMIERMGVDVDVGKLKTTYAKWRARGYNKTNYDGFVDWYTNGIPEQGKKQNGSNQRDQGTSGNRATTTDRLAATADIISQYPSEAELGRQR